MNPLPKIIPSANGMSFTFSENPEFLNYLRDLFPAFEIIESLSLSQWENVHHSHKLKLKFDGPLAGMTTEVLKTLSIENAFIQTCIQNAVIDYMEFVVEKMHSLNYARVSVVMSEIVVEGIEISPIELTPNLKVFLKAVFIPK